MMNLLAYLQNCFLSYPYGNMMKIIKSPLSEYDYQVRINQISSKYGNNEIKNLEEYVKNNNDIISKFDYTFTSSGTSSGTQMFLSFTVNQMFSLKQLNIFLMVHDDFYFGNRQSTPKHILYDYSSPNIAKDMHVGHLKSTILGDALSNISEYLGNTVMRINHIGDFGLPFGVIVEYIIRNNITVDSNTSLQQIYISARKAFDDNDDFKECAYVRTKELQENSNEYTTSIWTSIYKNSIDSYNKVYTRLNISENLNVCGESHYYKYIKHVESLLTDKNMISVDTEGRKIVNITNTNPIIFEKSQDRGNSYTYGTTDLCALWYRSTQLKCEEIYYVVDEGQSLHFKQLFTVGKDADWLTEQNQSKHVAFGILLGKDGKRLKSRDGRAPKLNDVINEGIDYVTKMFETKNTVATDDKISKVAIGSIKYYDLSKSRSTNYKFDFDNMMQSTGNTYTYISYSIARCNKIISNIDEFDNGLLPSIQSINKEELQSIDYTLLRKICHFTEILELTDTQKMPHYLCEYAHELAYLFNDNYTNTRCIEYNKDNEIISINCSRVIIYMFVNKSLKTIFKLLSLSPVDTL